jgi:Zn-dependent protease
MDDWAGKLFYLTLFLPAFVSALTVHEFAHAWAADRLGDNTPRSQGRLTLDPLAHLDPIGSLLIVFSILVGFPIIGFAKPVMTNPRNFRNPRRDSVLVAIAGPISNLLQLVVWFIALFAMRLIAERINPNFVVDTLEAAFGGTPVLSNIASIVGAVMATGILVNLGLAAFNMIPIPPLDGHWVLEGLGPPFITDLYNLIRPYSFILLYVLLWTNTIRLIMTPVYDFAQRLVAVTLGVPI